jgi:hypothetical protein
MIRMALKIGWQTTEVTLTELAGRLAHSAGRLSVAANETSAVPGENVSQPPGSKN